MLGLRALSQAVGELIERSRFGNVAGITYGGKRDLYRVLGYQRQLFPRDYRARYERNGVANRIVETFPKDTWRGGAEVWDDENPDTDTEFELACADLARRLRVWPTLKQADILAGIGQYAVILIGAPGQMDQPLESAGPDDIQYLRAYSQEDAGIEVFDTDSQSPRFGYPLFYTLKRADVTFARGQATNSRNTNVGRRVHYSRIIHIVDNVLDDVVFGAPRLQKVWNLIDDLEKVTGGGAEAFWRRADQGMNFNVDPTVDLEDDEVQALKEQTDAYVHRLKRHLVTRGVEVNTLGSDVADFKSPVDSIISQLSAATGIPQRVLMGSEQGKLAAKADKEKYDELVESRRADVAGPQMAEVFWDRMIELGAVPEPKDGRYLIQWSQLKTADEGEKLNAALTAAQINQTQGQEVVTTDEIRTRILGLPVASEEQKARNNVPKEPAVAAGKEKSSWAHVHRAADTFRTTVAARRWDRVPRKRTEPEDD